MGALQLGDKGRAVVKLQKILNELGYDLPTDGVFSQALLEAVRDFQTNKEIEPDGIVDRQTKITMKRLRRKMRRAKRRGESVAPLQTTHSEPDLIPEPEDDDDEFDAGLVTEEKPLDASEEKKVETAVAEKKITSLSEAQGQYQALVKAGASAAALGAFRKRAILEVYGNAPTVAQINQLKELVYGQAWLKPEGEDLYLYYITDSPNYFKGGVMRKGIYYGYTATRLNDDTFDIKIYRVFNNQSNLVMNTRAKATLVADKAQISLPRGVRESYKWNISSSEILSVSLTKGATQVSLAPSNMLKTQADAQHGVKNHTHTEEADFSLKNALKTALKAFIAEYGNLLK
ncbi:peptidoglycan-binding domain-containing protein [Hugenholtzia roseola]|uniref:peptidoglycan-binding domain-containing protein n=1 Tax=Hugenholtzia roseola TaxID=1002 RepID=UPI00040FC035|nr:peptidoglycan-binding domain-containing protein [Hugenholtzia roseola]